MAAFAGKRNHAGALFVGVAAVLIFGGATYAFFAAGSDATASSGVSAQVADAGSTGSVGAKRDIGRSGLPLPRFVSLKTGRVNVRRGPSSEHQVSWVFTRKGLPVEIIAEFEHWRRVRDSDGEEGWIYQSLLAGRRTAIIAPWRKQDAITLWHEPSKAADPVARISGGVVGEIEKCTGKWCQMSIGGYDGWVEQAMLWGVYPGEKLTGN